MRQICTLDWEGLQADIALADHFSTIGYHAPVRSLSSAVLGGGFNDIRRVLNLKVQANPDEIKMTEKTFWDPPEKTLAEFVSSQGWEGPAAGMMTSALMESFRFSVREESWGGVFCSLTAGISNALAAGDAAAFLPEVKGNELPTGTINIMVGTNAELSDSALAEALMVATEAKTAILFSFGIKSTLSGAPATGTGTDSLIISSGSGPKADYCGKHTKIGQLIGETVSEALASSVAYLLQRDHPSKQYIIV